MSQPPPPLSPEARAAAAARAVRARQLRAELRLGLREGTVDVAALLREGQADDERGRIVARMKVLDLLASFRGVGPIRAADMMDRIGIAANRRVGGLGPRQRDELVDLLAQRGGR